MNTVKTWQTVSSKQEDTYAIGELLGRECRGGEVFLLSSDLGGGKTSFTKGLASGLGSRDTVTSPTFMVSRVYACRDGLSLHHFDFYRLNEGGMVGYELSEVVDDPKAVTVVEWSENVTDIIPSYHLSIYFERMATDDSARKIIIEYPEELEYILAGCNR